MEVSKTPLFLLPLLCILIISRAADTITKTQNLADGETLVSAGGSFELGFFSPENSKNRYVGIWYKKIPVCTVVWVANRETPLTDKNGVLKLVDPGIIVLLNSSNGTVWFTNASSTAPNPVVKLLDSGNLVLKLANSDDSESNFVWQSFDYPCDTLLPGMKLGKDFVTGLDRYLSSWKSKDDPAQGDYTYKLDPQGYPQAIISRGSIETYRSGPWNGARFSGRPNQKPNNFYKFGMVFNAKEVYYYYDLVNPSVVSRLFLDQSGFLRRFTWIDQTKIWDLYLRTPADDCDTYNKCGAYGICNIASSPVCSCLSKFVASNSDKWGNGDWASGCIRRTPLSSDCNRDGFIKYSGIKLPDTRHSWISESMGLKECKLLCLKNCSCTAYSTLNISGGGDGTGCLFWSGDLVDIRQYSGQDGQDIYIRMASSELARHSKRWEIVAVILALFVTVLLLSLSLLLLRRRRRRKRLQPQGERSSARSLRYKSEQDHNDRSQKEDLELPFFDFSIIAEATNDFSAKNKLGEGGFGPVYMGRLKCGQEIAVKRLSKNSSQGLDQFKNEVIYIAKLQHRNLVKLLGCCIEGEEKLLIYEYMPNKSLDYFIFDQERKRILDWPKRFHVITGIARGLLYLHQDSRLRIIHRDLKASNILLDIDMNARISDFGMARSFGGNETEANTQKVVGTYGYMSPEYMIDGVFSIKSDVFSFGVLVLEIVSGKRNRGFNHQEHRHNLLGHAWRLYKEDRLEELIDQSLGNSILIEVLRSIHVGLLCVQQSPEDRPSMASVVLMLGSEGALAMPKQPGFFTERDIPEFYSSFNLSRRHLRSISRARYSTFFFVKYFALNVGIEEGGFCNSNNSIRSDTR
ncbi:Non-specific serine/threonine protein kinase [Bertholletia excelsa]